MMGGMLLEKHHAILFEGDREAGLHSAREYVTRVLGITIEQNPDVLIMEHDRVTIEIAQGLTVRALQRPFGTAQAFIVGCETILHEAQNALLKLLEEPAQNTHFIFVLPSRELLLPTVRSRMMYAGRVEGTRGTLDFAEQFILATPRERSAMVAPIIKDKDRVLAQELVRHIERYLHDRGVKNNARMLREVALAGRYINNRSSSIKMILEHLAVTL